MSHHAATVMREGTAPKRGLLGFFEAVWGRAEPQVCSRAVVCSCPCNSPLLSRGWDKNQVILPAVMTGHVRFSSSRCGSDLESAFVAVHRQCPGVCLLLLQDTRQAL